MRVSNTNADQNLNASGFTHAANRVTRRTGDVFKYFSFAHSSDRPKLNRPSDSKGCHRQQDQTLPDKTCGVLCQRQYIT